MHAHREVDTRRNTATEPLRSVATANGNVRRHTPSEEFPWDFFTECGPCSRGGAVNRFGLIYSHRTN